MVTYLSFYQHISIFMRANKVHYFLNLFDKVFYMF